MLNVSLWPKNHLLLSESTEYRIEAKVFRLTNNWWLSSKWHHLVNIQDNFRPRIRFFPMDMVMQLTQFSSLPEAEPMTPAFSLKLLKCQFDQFGRKSPNQSLLRRSWNFLWNRTHRPELGAWCHMPVRSWGPTCGTYTTLDQALKFPEIPFSRTTHSRDGTVSVSELLNRDLTTVGWWTQACSSAYYLAWQRHRLATFICWTSGKRWLPRKIL